MIRSVYWKPPLWQFVIAMAASFALGWNLEDCWHEVEPQPAIAPGGLP